MPPTSTATPSQKDLPMLLFSAGIILGGGIFLSAFLLFLMGTPQGGATPLALFLGRFHPLILHLPIGGFALLISAELFHFFTKNKESYQKPRLFLLSFTSSSAILAATLGYLLGKSGNYNSDPNLNIHFQWSMIFTLAIAINLLLATILLIVKYRLACITYFVSLLFTIVSLTLAGHAGGNLTHGEEYLTSHAPKPIKKTMEQLLGIQSTPEGPSTDEIAAITVTDRDIYTHVVAPILENYCYSCHSSSMQKGRLRLDSYEAILAGGKIGPAIVAGEIENSLLLTRMELPLEEELRMPPKDKPQHDDTALLVLKEWVRLGAPSQGKVGEMDLSKEALAAISSGIAEKKPTREEPTLNLNQVQKRSSLKQEFALFHQHWGSRSIALISQENNDIYFSDYALTAEDTVAAFAALKPFADHITDIDLSKNGLSPENVQALPVLTKLQKANLPHSQFTQESLRLFAEKAPNIRTFIAYNSNFDKALLEHLDLFPHLTQVVLSLTEVDLHSAKAWSQAHPEVEVILNQDRFLAGENQNTPVTVPE